MIEFKIFGIKFLVSIGFIGSITLMQYIDKTGLMLPGFFALLFHELGHIIFMKLFKVSPKKIILKIGAANIEVDFAIALPKKTVIFLAGPAFNFLGYGIFTALYSYSNNKAFLINSFAMLSVGIFNLIPARGLDGGSIVDCIMTAILGGRMAELVLTALSVISTVAVLAFGTVAFIKFGNPSPIIMSVYLFVLTLLKKS